MDLLPHSTAVGKVMEQLTGRQNAALGPGDATTSKDFGLSVYNKLLLWNRNQKNFNANTPKRAIIESDFGCGKSILLHTDLLNCQFEDPSNINFLISFLQSKSTAPYVPAILDISNKLRYHNQGIEVIDVSAIMAPSSKLRQKLGMLPLRENEDEDVFKFLFDLTAAYPQSNVCVDEVCLEDLSKTESEC